MNSPSNLVVTPSRWCSVRIHRILSFLPPVILLLCGQLVQAASVFTGASQIVVFGDSASSTTIPPGQEFRFTNDLVWAEYLGNTLKLQATIYAEAGGYTFDDSSRFSLFRQMDNYYADYSGGIDPNAVHFFYIGGNDIIPLQDSHLNRQRAMEELIAKGASNIVLVNLPSPWRYSTGDLLRYVPDGVVVWDLMDVLLDLNSYGINSSLRNCQQDPVTCDNALLWDGQHPASGLHKAIAQHMQATLVPVPSAVWLFASACLGLFGIARRD